MPEIRLASLLDIPALKDHLQRHGVESGRDGDPIFAPFEEPWNRTEEDLRKESEEGWSKPTTEPGWERTWLLVDFDGIHGEITLSQRPPLKTALHRATLMMGIERTYRRRGFGAQMIQAALHWARQQPTLDWIDLNVFANNEPAIALYTKLGFYEIGRWPDLFRVHGLKIDDIHMVFDLRTNK